MRKSVLGSFIIHCDKGSYLDKELNNDIPTYDGKKVCVIQLEWIIYNEGLRMIYELVYME